MNQDILYKEVQRQIDYQIEANRWLENQAGRLLRILIALIGILLSVAGRFVLTIYNSEVGFTLVDVEKSASILTNQYNSIGTVEASLIIAILAMSGTLFLYLALLKLFYETPKNAMEIIWSSPIDAGINIGSDTKKIDEDYYFRNLRKGVVDQYSSKIEQNQQVLEKTRESWEKCHQSIESGIWYFLLMVGAIVPLAVYTDPFLMVVNFLVILAYLGSKILSYISWSDTKTYMFRNKYTDISLLLLAIFYYTTAAIPDESVSGPLSLLLSALLIIGMLLLAIVPYKETTNTTAKLLVRNGVSALLFSSLLFLLTNGKSGTLTEIANTHFFERIIYSLAISTFIISLSLVIILFLWNLYFAGRSIYDYFPTEKFAKAVRTNTNR